MYWLYRLRVRKISKVVAGQYLPLERCSGKLVSLPYTIRKALRVMTFSNVWKLEDFKHLTHKVPVLTSPGLVLFRIQ